MMFDFFQYTQEWLLIFTAFPLGRGSLPCEQTMVSCDYQRHPFCLLEEFLCHSDVLIDLYNYICTVLFLGPGYWFFIHYTDFMGHHCKW